MKVGSKAYCGKDDDQPVREFLRRHYAATQHPYFSVDPPNWERISAAVRRGSNRRTIQLWELSGNVRRTVVGMLVLHKKRSEFSILVDLQYRGIEVEMIDWVEKGRLAAETVLNEKKPLRCTVCEKAEEQKALLAQRGYIKGKPGTIFRRRTLDGRFLAGSLPPGYNLLQVQGAPEELLEARAKAENEVFNNTITAEFLGELQKAPIYRPELDLVITAPDSSIAAFCTAWLDAGNQVGYFEPVAALPDHRCKGLGKVLMIEGLGRLHKMGAELAYLGNDVDNIAGNRLYDSVGMPVFDQEHVWHKGLTL